MNAVSANAQVKASLTWPEIAGLTGIMGLAAAVGGTKASFRSDPLTICCLFTILAFVMTYCMIRWLGPAFMKANLKGRDMSKAKAIEIPETMGGVCAAVYLLLMILFMPFLFLPDVLEASALTSSDNARSLFTDTARFDTALHRFPLGKLAAYQSALLSLALVVILGNYDDLFDIRWRHKVGIPAVAAIPMLAVYFLTYGVTHVVVPIPFERYLGEVVDLGWLYYAYMGAVAVFCPNSINILAGINGIEVAQSLVIGILLLCNDLVSLSRIPQSQAGLHPATDIHMFSIYLLLPFLGSSFALLRYNWYPAQVFVGDTYCYFAGMVFAIVGISGHFSKTLLLLFVPQILNFLYSMPQLLRIIPCPRHRLPAFDRNSGLLKPSMTYWTKPPSPSRTMALKLLANTPLLPLIKLEKNAQNEIIASSNFTLINLWLVWRGPQREDRLAIELILFQSLVGALGLIARHEFAAMLFKHDNRL